jgi:hypothetical protein
MHLNSSWQRSLGLQVHLQSLEWDGAPGATAVRPGLEVSLVT